MTPFAIHRTLPRRFPLRIGFVTGLPDHKLAQKLAPLQALAEVGEILLFRRRSFQGDKVRWLPVPGPLAASPWRGDPWRLAQLWRHAPRCDLLVGCHQEYHGVMAALAGAWHPVPVIQLLISQVAWAMDHPLFRWSLGRAAAVALRGERSDREFREAFRHHWPHRPLPVLFHPPNWYRPPATPPLAPLEDREFDILFVGSFTHAKDPVLLADTLGEVCRRRPSTRACLVGAGELEGELRARLERHGVGERVTLAGQRPPGELDHYYGRARVKLLTSRVEGLPMVIPEAFRWGVPVVTSPVGDIATLVADGVNGRMVTERCPRAFADAVLSILEDPARASAMGRAALHTHERFVQESSLEKAAAAWRECLIQLSQGPRSN